MIAPIRETIAITGMNATDNPGPGVAVTRALRHEPTFAGRIVGLGYDPLDPGFYADGLLDDGAILPFPSLGAEAFFERICQLSTSFGIQALLPTLDSEIRAVISLEARLRTAGIGTFVPTLDAVERASKPQLPKLAASAGINIPDSETVMSVENIPAIIKRFGLPLVVKGVYYGAYVVQSEASAISAFHHFAATWGLPVVFQSFLQGDEYNVCALGDGTGNTIGAVAMRKLALTDKGKGSAGVTVSAPALIAIAHQVIDALRWRGPLEVEIMATRSGGEAEEYHVIEINPRFPAWVYLTTAAGQNLPYYCARLALGLPVPASLPAYTPGRMFVRISLDQIADMNTFGQLSATGMVRNAARMAS